MDFKTGLLLVALAIGCAALPAQPEDDMSIFFEHVDQSARIVGGTEAAVGSHPHMAAMSTGTLLRSFLCGASIISDRTVLTAAHCIDAVFSFGSLSSSLRVTVGTNRWNSGGRAYLVARNVTHPNYVSATIKNDLGLLITTIPIVYSPLVSPIGLSFNYVDGGVPSRVAGWGRIRTGGSISATLLEINTNTITGEQCVTDAASAAISLNMRAPPVEPHIEICTYHSPGVGNCNGDSGSALVRTDTNQQIGVVSWGMPCARGAPDMFARVSYYRSWIQESMQ